MFKKLKRRLFLPRGLYSLTYLCNVRCSKSTSHQKLVWWTGKFFIHVEDGLWKKLAEPHQIVSLLPMRVV